LQQLIEYNNETEYEFSLELVKEIASGLTNKIIELLIVDKDVMQNINFEQRGIDKSTDVLSFPYDNMPMAPLGSIVICLDYILDGAKEFKHTPDEEFTLLFIHGLLHILGYDHETDNNQMRDMERDLIKQYGLPNSLIVRNKG